MRFLIRIGRVNSRIRRCTGWTTGSTILNKFLYAGSCVILGPCIWCWFAKCIALNTYKTFLLMVYIVKEVEHPIKTLRQWLGFSRSLCTFGIPILYPIHLGQFVTQLTSASINWFLGSQVSFNLDLWEWELTWHRFTMIPCERILICNQMLKATSGISLDLHKHP